MDEDEITTEETEETARSTGPNWKAIVGSTAWKRQVKPWLQALYVEALEEMAPPGAPGTPTAALATVEGYHYHRGRVDMLRKILLTPEGEMELERTTQEMETRDAEKQRQAASDYRRRRATL